MKEFFLVDRIMVEIVKKRSVTIISDKFINTWLTILFLISGCHPTIAHRSSDGYCARNRRTMKTVGGYTYLAGSVQGSCEIPHFTLHSQLFKLV